MRSRKVYNYRKLKTDELSELLCHIHFYLKRYGTYEVDQKVSLGYIAKDYLIAYCLEGCNEVLVGPNVYECKKGSYLVLTPYQFCQFTSKSEQVGKFYFFHFDVDDTSMLYQFNSLLSRNGNVITNEEIKDLSSLFTLIKQEEDKRKIGYKSVVQGVMRQVIVEIIRCQIAKNERPYVEVIYQPYLKIVSRGIEYIEQHYQDSIRLTDMAKYLDVSTSVLYKAFMQILGVPPAAFIQEKKILVCKKMLEEGQRIGVIYQLLGYSSAYHLSKSFKQHAGVSPRDYKKCLKLLAKY